MVKKEIKELKTQIEKMNKYITFLEWKTNILINSKTFKNELKKINMNMEQFNNICEKEKEIISGVSKNE